MGTTVSIPLIPYNTGAGGGAPLHGCCRGAWGMSCHAQFFPAPSVGEERASAVFDLAYQQELYRLQGGAHEVGGGAAGEGGAGGIPSLQRSWGGTWGGTLQQQFPPARSHVEERGRPVWDLPTVHGGAPLPPVVYQRFANV